MRGWAGQHTRTIYGMFMGVPGLKVAVPSTAADAKGLMTTAIRDDNPVAYFHHYLLTLEHGDVPDGEYAVPFGEAAVRREGGDVTIVAIGWMVDRALAAAEQLAGEGIQAEVIDPRTLAPLDTATILQSVAKTGRLVVVDQSTRHGSAAAVIAAEVASEAFGSLKGPVKLVTALDADPFRTASRWRTTSCRTRRRSSPPCTSAGRLAVLDGNARSKNSSARCGGSACSRSAWVH